MIKQSRLSIERIHSVSHSIDPVFLNSPQYKSELLSQFFDCSLIVKNEIQNPIKCFKGRGCDWLVSQIKEEKEIICASAGNFGQGMAYSCRKKGIRLRVFASERANLIKLKRMTELGAEVILYGDDFDAAKNQAKEVALKEGIRFVEDSLDIETVEGAGTIGLELIEIPEKIDYVLISLGNGALVNGIARIFKEYSPNTKVVAVQSEGAPAMISSWREKRIIKYEKTDTIADGIAVRVPIPQALEDMEGLVDEGLLVNDENIKQGMKLLFKSERMIVEPSAAVGIAALLENKEKFKTKTVVTIVCGGNLAEDQFRLLQ